VTGEGKRRGSAERVRRYLESHGMADQIHTFEAPTKTAQMAADAMGCELGQIVKSLVFVVGEKPVLALVAGDRRGDTEAIASLAGGGTARFADPQTVRDTTGYAIGGVSPFDLPDSVMVLLDDSLSRFEIVYPAGGTPTTMVQMSLEDLVRLSRGNMVRISL